MWNCRQYSTRTAAISEAARISYGELAAEMDRLAAVLPGRCLVFQFCTNSIGSLVGYAAFLENRIVPLLLPVGMDRDLLGRLLDAYRPAYLWLPTAGAAEFGCESVLASQGYSLLKTRRAPFALHDDLALLLTTSGSTGSPKLVRQSYANVRANAESIAEYLALTAAERPITTLPMHYTYGLSIINSHLRQGATLLLTDRGLMQREFWAFFKEHGATSFGGVPYTYEMLKQLRFFRMDLPSLATMTQAGGKLAPELHREFAAYARATGKRFFVMYGQTEATARMAYLPPAQSLEKCGSMGIAIPGGRFELIDGNGQTVAEPETVGELVYYGPNVTLGYAETGADLAKGDENHGRLATGDMAKRDADGFYYVVGRKKRFLKIFGNRVNLDEAERMIKARFATLDCACAGVDDRMTVFITAAAQAEAVRDFLAGKTGLNPAAFVLKTIAEIPKNESGKTLYAQLAGLA